MHEFFLAESLVQAVLEELKKLEPDNGRLKSVLVVIGEMRQVVPDTLSFAYQTLTQGTRAEGSVIEIESKPITADCRQCEWRGQIDNGIFCCPQCESGDLEIVTGRELYLASMEFANNDDPEV